MSQMQYNQYAVVAQKCEKLKKKAEKKLLKLERDKQLFGVKKNENI